MNAALAAPIVHEDDNGDIQTYSLEEMLILSNHMAVAVAGYERVLRNLIEYSNKPMHKHRSGAQVQKGLQLVLEETLTDVFKEQKHIREKTANITRNGRGITNYLVSLGQLVAAAQTEASAKASVETDVDKLSKYENLVVGDAVTSTSLTSLEELQANAEESRKEEIANKLKAAMENAVPMETTDPFDPAPNK